MSVYKQFLISYKIKRNILKDWYLSFGRDLNKIAKNIFTFQSIQYIHVHNLNEFTDVRYILKYISKNIN